MLHSDSVRLLDRSLDRKRLARTLHRVQATLGLPDSEWLEMLEATPRDWAQIRTGRISPRLSSVISLSRRLGVSVHTLQEGSIDYPTLVARFEGDREAIPDKYLRGAGSRCTTALNIVDCLEEMYGWHNRVEALRRLQLSEAALSQPARPVNFKLMTDLLDYMHSLGATMGDYARVGQNFYKKLEGSPLAIHLKRQRNMEDFWESLFLDWVPSMDSNMNYKIESLSPTSVLISATPSEALKELWSSSCPGTLPACIYRAGSLSTFQRFKLERPAVYEKTNCVHLGDSACKYILHF